MYTEGRDMKDLKDAIVTTCDCVLASESCQTAGVEQNGPVSDTGGSSRVAAAPLLFLSS